MKPDRSAYTKGMRLTGGACPGQVVPSHRELLRKTIVKGASLISDAGGPVLITKSSNLPVRYGDPPSLDAIKKRIDALAIKIEQAAKVVRHANKRA